MALYPDELLIDDATPDDDLLNPVVDGEPKGRGHDPLQVVKGMYAAPTEMTLIPRSEWSARIKEQEETKSRISDILLAAGVPSMDQGQVGYSHSEDTEVLTEKGWTCWPDWNRRDMLASVNLVSGLMEFQVPTEWHAYEYDDEMFYATNRRLDFGVTRNHRMLVRKWDERRRTLSDDYCFQRADELGWYVGMLAAPRGYIGTEFVQIRPDGTSRQYDGNDFLALLALIVSDGYAGGSPKNLNSVSFCCFDERYATVAALAARTGFKEQAGRRGVWNLTDGAFANWVRVNCYTADGLRSPNKKVPDFVKVASGQQIKHFLQSFGDRDRDREHYYSSSKRLVDDLQELFLRIGKRATISANKARVAVRKDGRLIDSKPSYELHVSTTDRLSLERKHNIEREHYRGLVYCATVPNGTLITRRNGTVLLSGNCWAHSTTGCVQAVRAINNEPYVPLSAYAIAATIKHGADEGGWCGLSAKFLRERGVPSQTLWPQGDRNYRKYDKPEVWANAELHKVTEEWVDLTQDVYDENLTFDQLATCLLTGTPCAVDMNWWSHSIMACDLVEVEPGSFGIRIRNSWSDSWGSKGFSVLQGNKARPDGALAIRVTGASTN